MARLIRIYYVGVRGLPDLGLLVENNTPNIPDTKLNQRYRPDGGTAGAGRYINRWVFGTSKVISGGTEYLLAGEAETHKRWRPYSYLTRETGTFIKIEYPHFYHAAWKIEWDYPSGELRGVEIEVYTDMNVTRVTGNNSVRATGKFAWYGRLPYSGPASTEAVINFLEVDFASSRRKYDLPEQSLDTRVYYNWRSVSPDLKFSPEMDDFEDRVDLLPHFGLDGAMAAAFVDSVDHMPNLDSMNNIANALDLLKLLGQTLGVILSRKVTRIGKLGEAWLGYRYAYSTTKADVGEAIGYMNRLLDLSRSKSFRSNGQYRQGEWLVRAVIHIDTDFFRTIRSKLERYSVELNAYNLWDLLPYSFIVDWFLDVGGLLELYGSRNVALKIKEQGAWFSIERRWKNEYGFDEIFYYRFFDTPNLAYVARESHGAKAVTWLKRTFDVISLFT